MSIFKYTPFQEDNSLLSKKIYTFNPITGTQFNNPGPITITVQNTDSFWLPSESWLEFEGTLGATAGEYTKDSLISFCNNGILYLFDNIKYLLSGTEIESVFHPGHACTVINLAKYSAAYNTGPGLLQCWA